MSEWREVELGDVLTLQRGFDITKKEQRAGSIPVVSSSGISSFHDEAKADGPGVVIGRKGSLGTAFFLRESFWPHDTTLWVKDFKGNDPYFCYLLLRTLRLAELDAGSSNPTLNRNHAHLLQVRVPDLPTQTRVSSILSAVDDLIEIDKRRIELFEDLARTLYRDWFVRYRFPGHEDVRLVASELGPIPVGWELKRLGDVSENFDRLRRPLSKAERSMRGGDFPYYGAAKLIDWIDSWIFEGEHLLFAEDGTVQTSEGWPVLQLVGEQFWANNHTHILRGTELSTRFLFLAVSRYPISGHVTGAAQPKITQSNLNRIPILSPPADLLEQFELAMNPMLDAAHNAKKRSARLGWTRDLLLSRLVTGRLDISDIDLGHLASSAVV